MITKQMLDAYIGAREWYNKAQTTDCGQDSMYNQGRIAVKAFLDAFEAMFSAPAIRFPVPPYVVDGPYWPPPTYPPTCPPYGTEITCGPQATR